MKGLILKDLYFLKKQWHIIAILVVALVALNFISGLGVSLTQFITLFILSIFISYSMINSEIDNWEEYALTMPVSRREIVKSKYILTIIMMVIGLILGTTIGLITNFMANFSDIVEFTKIANLETKYIIVGLVGSIFVYSTIVYADLPLSFKDGGSKSKQKTYIFYFAIFIIYALVKKYTDFSLIKLIINYPLKISIVLSVLILIIFVISYILSVKFMDKKEY